VEDWYWIGVAAGIGVAIGVLLAAFLAPLPWRLAGVALAAVGGALVGLAIDSWDEGVAGGAGGFLGAVGVAPLVAGALARGGARLATGALVAGGALALAALAFVPGAGYVEALAAPVLGARLRRAAGRRYAGLRTLVRD
jgi:hypothetical protein